VPGRINENGVFVININALKIFSHSSAAQDNRPDATNPNQGHEHTQNERRKISQGQRQERSQMTAKRNKPLNAGRPYWQTEHGQTGHSWMDLKSGVEILVL